jgi:hypothetical protein
MWDLAGSQAMFLAVLQVLIHPIHHSHVGILPDRALVAAFDRMSFPPWGGEIIAPVQTPYNQ